MRFTFAAAGPDALSQNLGAREPNMRAQREGESATDGAIPFHRLRRARAVARSAKALTINRSMLSPVLRKGTPRHRLPSSASEQKTAAMSRERKFRMRRQSLRAWCSGMQILFEDSVERLARVAGFNVTQIIQERCEALLI
ncbi:hypothetical protein [uncultured Bradyrhizobium sp.]|jgi:hypothetical protein|uniref:hypothetical protein n=1 Tax=uncultured Bradyrhizobium sp. TaxID=199684 RepID=UPI002633596A|nr:hypothetical protein [uncultured Bradyrhizobium sp.]